MPLPMVPAPMTPTTSICMRSLPLGKPQSLSGAGVSSQESVFRSQWSGLLYQVRQVSRLAVVDLSEESWVSDLKPDTRPDTLLFPVHAFFDHDLTVLLDRDHFVQVFEPRHGDVDDVVAGIEIEHDRRGFVEHVAVDGDLGALGLSFDADGTHACRFGATEDLLELATNFDFVGIAEWAQCGSQLQGLPNLNVR